jgi:uncharacterized membrane protein SirB2
MLAALISISGFMLRGIWMLRDSDLLNRRLTKTLPHIVDSILLGSALFLAVTSHQYPFVDAWLSAKLAALTVYIILGSLALKYGPNKSIRIIALMLALLTFSYIVAVARTRDIWPLLSV